MGKTNSLSSIYKRSVVIGQSSILLVSTVGEMMCLLIINYFLTRQLGTEQFGVYSLFINFFLLSRVIFNFGVFQATGRTVAIIKEEITCRQIYAASLLIGAFLYFIMNICLIVFLNTFQEYSFLFSAFVLTIPFNWIYLVQEFMELVLQGKNNISMLSMSRLGPRILFLLCVVFFVLFAGKLTVVPCLLTMLLSYVLVFLFILLKLKPLLSDVKASINLIVDSTKQFGFNIYIGSVFAVGVANLTGILISYYVSDTSNVGYYNLSLQLATPLTLIPNILATVLFTRFVDDKKINRKYEISVIGLCMFIALALYLLSNVIVRFLYGNDFLFSARLLSYLVVGSLFYGVANFYNRFLLAKGRGRELRNASFAVGLILLISNMILIKYYGVMGAAFSYIIAGIANFICVYYYYRTILKLC